MVNILLTGANGQLGFELGRSLSILGTVHATDRSSCDLGNVDSIRTAVRAFAPTIIVNAGAYTAVDRAETDLLAATAVNARAPGILGEEAARIGALLVHYSTDYVFDGTGTEPKRESDPVNPLNVYGETKANGETALRSSCSQHLMLRTSWVFGTCGGNFPRTILRLAGERDALRIISDQFGAPTSAHLIADVTAQLIAQWLARPTGGFAYGTYHLTAAGETTWYDLACYVIKRARDRGWSIKVRDEAIKAITTAEYPTAAKRPLNSRLDTSPLRNTFGLSLPPWQQGIDFVMRHWQERP